MAESQGRRRVSAADLDAFLARMRRHGGRIDQLVGQATADPAEALLSALTELELVYEHLLVATEELRVQQEQLNATQAELRATRQRYQELFEAAPVAYLVTTAEGVITEANRAAAAVLGAPARRGLGKPVQAFVDVPHRAALRRLLREVGRYGGVVGLDAVVVARGQRRIEVRITVGHTPDPAGGPATLRWVIAPEPRSVERGCAAAPALAGPDEPPPAGIATQGE